MVKPVRTKPKKQIDPEQADNFANKAIIDDSDNKSINNNKSITENYDNGEKKGRGNPRPKQTVSRSISINFELDSYIDETIKEAAKEGVFGITRSDVVSAALSSSSMKKNAIKEIKRWKTTQ